MLQQGFILVLSCLGLAQALFLCFYLFTLKKGNQRANRFLAFVLLGLTIRIGKSVFNNYMILDPFYRNLGISGILLSGPFLWFYGRVLLQKVHTFSKLNYLHLIPFGLFALLSKWIPNARNIESYLSYTLVLCHLATYVILSWLYILKIRKEANVRLLKWYRAIVIGASLICFFYLSNFIGFIPFYIGGAILYSLLVYGFSYLLLRRHVFALEKYSNSALDKTASKKILKQIKEIFEDDNTYLDQNISLVIVAEKLSISPRELSQVINENEGKNFSEFVNHYRVEKAKLLLVDPEYFQEKIATIAYDSGFGNVTSFNLAFKAETQQTPSQYRKQFKVA
ncbi:helix-turn-helix domain-containing protein [Aquimarina sp. 2201CG5-10]|uniref:helix-turn-helix domain-containing protein n=1 Tax=Aquimarina callyspongiae TaxID=3098150 RepID=UPI002AB5168C|nr:helix-turn-helix domain-containing protein [Aquimarina sp. 2201CG5-10]MDY8137151.1 helix-turn-helix domain-containing protein [Aquimarina sp. 2201CG5-10]